MKYLELHRWDVSAAEAVAIQHMLRSRVVAQGGPDPEGVQFVAGVDMGLRGDVMRAAAVVLNYPELQVVEESVAERPLTFPYVPGLLSFREAPAILEALGGLTLTPQLIFVDGQGIAHPRRFGIAAHLGVLLPKVPTVGVAKSILVGMHQPVGPNPGDRAPLVDRGEVVGYALCTRPKTKPVFISVGNDIGLEEAVEWTLRCCRGYKLPEPTRRAHNLASLKQVSQPSAPRLRGL